MNLVFKRTKSLPGKLVQSINKITAATEEDWDSFSYLITCTTSVEASRNLTDKCVSIRFHVYVCLFNMLSFLIIQSVTGFYNYAHKYQVCKKCQRIQNQSQNRDLITQILTNKCERHTEEVTWQKLVCWTHTASWRSPGPFWSLEGTLQCKLEPTASRHGSGRRVHPACYARRLHHVCCLSSIGSPKNLLFSHLWRSAHSLEQWLAVWPSHRRSPCCLHFVNDVTALWRSFLQLHSELA